MFRQCRVVPRAPLPLVVVLTLFAFGCSDPRAVWRERADRALGDADTRAAAIQLATGHASLPRPAADLTRVLVTNRKVVLDLTPRLRLHELPPGSAPPDFEQIPPLAPLEIAVVVDGHLQLPGSVTAAGHDTGLPLGDALELTPLRRSDLHSVSVLAEAHVSGPVLLRTLATLAELGTTQAELVLARGRGRVAARLSVRRTAVVAGHVEVAQHDLYAIELAAIDGGIAVRTSGGTLRPGCGTTGAEGDLAVPNVAGHLDAPGLAACVRKMREEAPELLDLFVRAAELDVSALAPLLAAVHEGADGESLDVVLLAAALARPSSGENHDLADILSGGNVTGVAAGLLVPGS